MIMKVVVIVVSLVFVGFAAAKPSSSYTTHKRDPTMAPTKQHTWSPSPEPSRRPNKNTVRPTSTNKPTHKPSLAPSSKPVPTSEPTIGTAIQVFDDTYVTYQESYPGCWNLAEDETAYSCYKDCYLSDDNCAGILHITGKAALAMSGDQVDQCCSVYPDNIFHFYDNHGGVSDGRIANDLGLRGEQDPKDFHAYIYPDRAGSNYRKVSYATVTTAPFTPSPTRHPTPGPPTDEPTVGPTLSRHTDMSVQIFDDTFVIYNGKNDIVCYAMDNTGDTGEYCANVCHHFDPDCAGILYISGSEGKIQGYDLCCIVHRDNIPLFYSNHGGVSDGRAAAESWYMASDPKDFHAYIFIDRAGSNYEPQSYATETELNPIEFETDKKELVRIEPFTTKKGAVSSKTSTAKKVSSNDEKSRKPKTSKKKSSSKKSSSKEEKKEKKEKKADTKKNLRDGDKDMK